MADKSNTAPIIIKRKKVSLGGGHHGGAWKVAYADFVTAMMAFFMLMWLLNATTEKQRKGIADYFSPSIPINRVSGGGEGSFGGTSVFSEEIRTQDGTGASAANPTEGRQARGQTGMSDGEEARAKEAAAETQRNIEARLAGMGGESPTMKRALQHVITRVTDEGLLVEIFDLPGDPLFEEGTDIPSPVMHDVTAMLTQVFGLVTNDIAVQGHVRSYPITLRDTPIWELSTGRAQKMRLLLQESGLPEGRIARVTGKADRELVVRNPMAGRNNRIEMILLRQDT